jgi:hypothetical protein
MAIVLDHSQRDGVYEFVLHDLSQLGELAAVLGRGEVDRARGLRRRFEEDLRLLDQIGWERADDRGEYAIRLGADEVRPVFARLRALTSEVIRESGAEFTSTTLEQAFGVAETCAVVLGELPGGVRPRP